MKFIRSFLSFIAFLLCLALFATTLATMLVADVRVITSKDNLKTIIHQYITSSLDAPSQPIRLAGKDVILYSEESEDTGELMSTLIDSVYEMLSEEFGDEVSISKEQIQDFVNESTLPEFVSEKAAEIINDIYSGELTTTITGEEIKELIEENKALLEEVLDVKITDEMVDSVTEMVEQADVTNKIQEMVSEILDIPVAAPEEPGQTQAPEDDGPGVVPAPPADGNKEPNEGIVGDVTAAVNNIKELVEALKNGEKLSLPVILNVLRSTTTKNVLLACIGACLVLMLLIFLCKLNRWYEALRNCGVVYLLAGIILLLPVGAAQLLPMLMGNNPSIPLIQLIAKMTLPVSGGVAVGGLVFIIIGSLSGSAVRRKARKKAEKEAMAAAELKKYVAVPTTAPVATIEDILTADAPMEDSVEEPAEESVEEPVEESAEIPAEASAEEPVEEEAAEEEPIEEEAADEPAEEIAAEVEEKVEEAAEV